MLVLSGGAGPQIVRIKAPADRVAEWFRGEELRVMPAAEFEARAARIGLAAGNPRVQPLLIKARHRARWDGSVLAGSSELVLAPGTDGGDLLLEPWSPAILPGSAAKELLFATDQGRLGLRLPNGARRSIVIDWELRPRSLPGAQVLPLALPACLNSELELELPAAWTPRCALGTLTRQAQAPAAAAQRWKITGDSDGIDFRAYVDASGLPLAPERAWVTSASTLDFKARGTAAGDLADWTTACRVEFDPRNSEPLELSVDPALELESVTGSALRSYRVERDGAGTRVTVALGNTSPAELVIRAHARMPASGAWPIPVVLPKSAVWLGGTASVLLGESSPAFETRATHGRRVGDRTAGTDKVTFECDSLESPADLIFTDSHVDASCLVRGLARLDQAPPRLECRLDYSVRRGMLAEASVELSRGWIPEQAAIEGVDEPVVWHLGPGTGGRTVFTAEIPATALAKSRLGLLIKARSVERSGGGPIEMPRVRALGVRPADESWAAWVDPETIVEPTLARGVAWLDPGSNSVGEAALSHARPALEWRYLTPDAMLRVERGRIDRAPWVQIHSTARMDPAARRLVLEGKVRVVAGSSSVVELPVWIDRAGSGFEAWRFEDESEPGAISARPLAVPAAQQLGFPAGGSALVLTLAVPARTERSVSFRARYAWEGVGSIPLLCVPAAFLARGEIRIESPLGTRTRVEATGLTRLDPGLFETAPADNPIDTALELETEAVDTSTPGRITHAYSYGRPGGRLEVAAERLTPLEGAGIVRQALLFTIVDADGRSIHRLRLVASLRSSRALVLKPPPMVRLIQVRRDGAIVPLLREGSGFRVPLDEATALRSTALVIDYESEPQAASPGARLEPILPGLDLPCASFVWDVATAPSRGLLAWGSGWVPAGAEPEDRLSTHAPPQAAEWPWITRFARWFKGEQRTELPELPPGSESIESTASGWLTRLDAGVTPILVDRLGLDTAGIGPRTRLASATVKPGASVTRAVLSRNGLAAVAIAGTIVVTSEDDARELATADWVNRSVNQTLIRGSDTADRFQTVARWRAEPTSRSGTAASDEPTDRLRRPPGWTSSRLVRAGWPDHDCAIELDSQPSRDLAYWLVLASAWISAAALLKKIPQARAGVIVAAAAMLLLAWFAPAQFANLAIASFGGVCAALGDQVARALANLGRPSSRVPRRTESSLTRRLFGAAFRIAIVTVIASSSTRAAVWPEQPKEQNAILAIFPYEGEFDPGRRLDRVVLRLVDYNRLIAASDPERSSATLEPVARSAVHRLRRIGAGACLVETELEIDVPGVLPSAWVFPAAQARELQAQVDGSPALISIQPGGRMASVSLPPGRGRRLVLSRQGLLQSDRDGQELNLPVGAVATARIVLETDPAEAAGIEIASRGNLAREGESRISGWLGPMDRIHVRWSRPAAPSPSSPRIAGEGLLLWETAPAGDWLRARFTIREGAGISVVRFGREPGLVARSVRVPGAHDLFLTEDAPRGEWILHVDPPLRAGAAIEIDCHRADAARKPARRLPRLEPVAWDSYSGLLGARRPGDWVGRLEAQPGLEIVPDLTFVAAWDRLPDTPLTFCGAGRFSKGATIALATSPARSRLKIKPTLAVSIEPGRLSLLLEASLGEISGRPTRIVGRLPDGMSVTEVSGGSVGDWAVDDQKRLAVELGPAPVSGERNLVVKGWIPIVENPLAVGSRRRTCPVPWINWEEPQEGAFLTLASATRTETRNGPGLLLISSESNVSAGTPGQTHRMTFRVEDSARLGELEWDSLPPRTNVSIESQLAIDLESAEWTAVLRYDVVGGALGAIHLRLPAVWAARATMHDAGEFQITRETRGVSAFWTITPQRPIWGSRRFVLRSSIPLPAEREIVHPEIAPLGLGNLDERVSILNATSRALTTDSSVGLRAIARNEGFSSPEFQRLGNRVGVFRVVNEPWVLRVQSPREKTAPREGLEESATARQADLAVVVAADRSQLGRVFYDVSPDARAFAFLLPESATLLWASVDGAPATPLRSARELWSVPVNPARASRVGLLWSAPPPQGSSRGKRVTVRFPEASGASTPAVIAIHAPRSLAAAPVAGSLEAVSAARYDLARADAQALATRDFLPRIDRSSSRDHERLTSYLVNHELILRDADRSALRDRLVAGSARAQSALKDAEMVALARVEWAELTRGLGLEADLAAARTYLGLENPQSQAQPRTGASESSPAERIPELGNALYLVGSIPGLPQSTAVSPVIELVAASPNDAKDLFMLTCIITLLIAVVVLGTPTRRRSRLRAGLAAALLLVGWAGGPLVLTAACVWTFIAIARGA